MHYFCKQKKKIKQNPEIKANRKRPLPLFLVVLMHLLLRGERVTEKAGQSFHTEGFKMFELLMYLDLGQGWPYCLRGN